MFLGSYDFPCEEVWNTAVDNFDENLSPRIPKLYGFLNFFCISSYWKLIIAVYIAIRILHFKSVIFILDVVMFCDFNIVKLLLLPSLRGSDFILFVQLNATSCFMLEINDFEIRTQRGKGKWSMTVNFLAWEITVTKNTQKREEGKLILSTETY